MQHISKKLPQRVPQHISESASFKLFASKIPNQWIIRDITERDYGIDCYLELVNDKNELSGELALIQLKSRDQIPWTKGDYYTLSNIDIATSNYWFQFAVPVFIFQTDLHREEVFFISVRHFIKQNFQEFSRQNTFSYRIDKSNKFEGKAGIDAFLSFFYYEHFRKQFENELLFFLSNLHHFQDFQNEHDNRDFHLGVEDTELIYFEAMHRNFRFLCSYLKIDNPIPTMQELKIRSKAKFKGNHYELYEHDLTEWVAAFRKTTLEIIKGLKSFLDGELSYWLMENPTVYNYLNNIKEDGELPRW